jgi:two-component system response regulator
MLNTIRRLQEVHMASVRSLSILLVDDNDQDAELALSVLRKLDPAAEFTRVKDGAEALEFIFREGAYRTRNRGLPSLILLDLDMPSVGGIDVLQTLRSDALTESIPIVILTGSGAERDRIDAAHLGAIGYVTKPIRLEDLKAFWPN